MQIKEVEQLTGLSAKAIRLYEDKGLLTVSRHNNGYRVYTQEDVEVLHKIKVLRYMGFSLHVIKDMLPQTKEQLKEHLEQHISQLTLEEALLVDKKRLSERLLKTFDFKHISASLVTSPDERLEVEKEMVSMVSESIWRVWLSTIFFGAFIILPFLLLALKDYQRLPFSIVMAMFCMVCLTWRWENYFKQRRNHRQITRHKNRREWYLLPGFILLFIMQLVLLFVMQMIVAHLIVPHDYIFFEMSKIGSFTSMILNTIALVVLGYAFKRVVLDKQKLSMKWVLTGVFVWCCGLYWAMTQVVAVTPTHVVFYAPTTITGRAYTYMDVKQIDAYIVESDSFRGLSGYRGDFNYQLTMHDGEKVVFHQPVVSSRYTRYQGIETYLELEDFDAVLVNLGIPKVSQLDHIDAVQLDTRYKERFRRIIENK